MERLTGCLGGFQEAVDPFVFLWHTCWCSFRKYVGGESLTGPIRPWALILCFGNSGITQLYFVFSKMKMEFIELAIHPGTKHNLKPFIERGICLFEGLYVQNTGRVRCMAWWWNMNQSVNISHGLSLLWILKSHLSRWYFFICLLLFIYLYSGRKWSHGLHTDIRNQPSLCCERVSMLKLAQYVAQPHSTARAVTLLL